MKEIKEGITIPEELREIFLKYAEYLLYETGFNKHDRLIYDIFKDISHTREITDKEKELFNLLETITKEKP
jgi:hypothetical protein